MLSVGIRNRSSAALDKGKLGQSVACILCRTIEEKVYGDNEDMHSQYEDPWTIMCDSRAEVERSMRRVQSKKTDCSIIAVDKFIQATRDSGYKGTASAISELVDNAIQARASEISISVAVVTGEDERQIEVSVLDNGCGMDPFTLRQALRFGGSSRFGDRKGLGRYGM